ncbi:hypothetical protein ACFQRL_09405 [Microbacterium fluvii]|uniref:Uncharacterized protein n=1 Tax=Microbacterium fluvii TaxID=415215 RepID=A0ABW2HCV4_9MICO|nr:hypothetical protein [Microbacterium fluvii]MCU4672806.1 hypothetical protein [Microbacterium fluvii]
MGEHDDELSALRERAYGPSADIHADPAAMARLASLEASLRADAVADAAADATGQAQPDDSADSPDVTSSPADRRLDQQTVGATAADAAAPDSGAPALAAEPDTSPRRPRRALVWAASIVVAALVGAGATLGVQSLMSGRVAVLGVEEGAEWPTEYFGSATDDSRVFTEFHGLSVAAVDQPGIEGVTVCLYVLDERGVDSQMMTAGCAAGSFPASASLVVTGDSPDELTEAFEAGTALLFVLEGDRVEVFASAPAPIETV